MQPMRLLKQSLDQLVDAQHYLFTPRGLKVLLPDLSEGAFKTLLSRAAKSGDGSSGYLTKLCRGLFLHPKAFINDGLLLFHDDLNSEIDKAAEETETNKSEILRKALQLFLAAREGKLRGLKLGLVEPKTGKLQTEIIGL